ncbi:hypothetical protein L7F22_040433, partial [Adiantum nelumboides]|nr:hypothetical protein [Adiantum nelumboides]
KSAKYQLNQALPLARNLLWGGFGDSKISKAAWDTYYLPKAKEGLGLLNFEFLITQLARKWCMRAATSMDYWALLLLKRNIQKFKLKSYKA